MISPYAAPTDNRFITIAFAGTTIERNTTVSRMKDRPSTSRMMIGVYRSEMSKKSFVNAVSPPTRTPESGPKACGTYWSRSAVTASTAAWLCESVASPANGIATSVTVPSWLVWGGWGLANAGLLATAVSSAWI